MILGLGDVSVCILLLTLYLRLLSASLFHGVMDLILFGLMHAIDEHDLVFYICNLLF